MPLQSGSRLLICVLSLFQSISNVVSYFTRLATMSDQRCSARRYMSWHHSFKARRMPSPSPRRRTEVFNEHAQPLKLTTIASASVGIGTRFA